MEHKEQWIWLPASRWPENQTTIIYATQPDDPAGHYTVAEFERQYAFDREVVSARLRFSADTAVQLYCNGAFVATGPASVGGDFIGNETVRDNFYAFETEIHPKERELRFFARVRMMPVQICEYSKGRGGFMLSAILTFDDGSQRVVCTDETWLARRVGAYCASGRYDSRIAPEDAVNAQVIPDIWRVTTAPIPVRSERALAPEGSDIALAPGEKKTVLLEFDMIYAGFVWLRAETGGELEVSVTCRELSEKGVCERAVFAGDGEYRGFCVRSAGNLLVEAENRSAGPARLRVRFIDTHYPVTEEAENAVSDPALNQVLKTCKHTLMICRQTHHLDGPGHCEPLACTGDYYIESLMTLFSFGDMRLAEFDVVRTAVLLERENGRMFHTTYSCIWVRMLLDMYMITGHRTLLERCARALDLLLRRFETYIGDNGLIETPPDYMFVDWIYIDGLSMHHPPKALGQTCLNMFYFGALDAAEKVYDALSRPSDTRACAEKREALREAVNGLLFDAEKRCYFEGLNTPTDEALLGKWMPPNVSKRYYLKQSNILAAYFGVCDDDTGRDILRRIMSDEIGGDCQPYFMHFLLEAVYRLGLRENYTLSILERWKQPVLECPKGIAEGFVKPEPTYQFDHSHAWAGTPLYALPKALLGLEIAEPGMRALRLSPSTLGLAQAHVELLTPLGRLVCDMRGQEEPVISCPEGIRLSVSQR
ncbi:MAG: hypothetical protein IKO07_01225 [Clostridia bacterium]|nr:hypothetical protein [Clostridia bacterium]